MHLRAPAETMVLVAIITSQRDFRHALNDGWYRIPIERAPRRLAADYLALYQTKAFGLRGACVRYVAPILGWKLCRRIELLPDEPCHPRAERLYCRLCLGSFEELERPVPSERLRRITFIATTMGRLLNAADVRDLWQGSAELAGLCADLRAEGFSPADRRLREGQPLAACRSLLDVAEWRIPACRCPGQPDICRRR